MLTPITLALGIFLIIVPLSEAAGKSQRHSKMYVRHAPTYVHREPSHQSDGWYPHDTSKLPMGSRQWFDQMLRENRRGNPG
jgi:hypothetical protein